MLAGFSVSNVGHCHPDVVAAIREQSQELIHYFDLPNDPRERLAERLCALAPGDREKRVVFGVTGADAIELAIKAARWYTGAPTILSGYGGYHGTTGGTMATTAKGGMWGFFYPVGPHDAGHAKIPFSYPYRCPVGAESARSATSSTCCSSSTRSRPAWGAAAGCGRASTRTSSRTCWRRRRGSRAECRSRRLSGTRRSRRRGG